MTSLPPHSPAELLLLLQKYHNPSLRRLLRVTFLDLLRQQVLAVSTEHYRPHPHDPVSWQQFVISGPTLATHQALPHEQLLVDTLRADDQLRIPFKQYVRMVFDKARSAPEYHKLIEANTRTGELFSPHWFWRLTSTRYLTPGGKQMQAATEAELARLDKEFISRAASNPSGAHHFSQQLGGVVFLLPSFSSEVGRQLERELHQIPEPTHDTTGDFGGSDDGGTSWHPHSDAFDSHSAGHGDSDSSSSSSSSGDSGCGGDSGCSGCGGGCGGD
ncbi:hypothetical protein [Hymenobacter sp.]|jgi:uncharacterized membrane protein YgcG|uniref:hypothetical protein n=1 Tax=Hymenobacter sp. TaxID=1898978 RepID=UPI002ED95105